MGDVRHTIVPGTEIHIDNASEAMAVLKMLAAADKRSSIELIRAVTHALIAWIDRRELEIAAREGALSDIEHGCAHLMLQVAEQVGRRRKDGRM